MMRLVSAFKLEPLLRISAFLYIFILVTFVAVAFSNCILLNLGLC